MIVLQSENWNEINFNLRNEISAKLNGLEIVWRISLDISGWNELNCGNDEPHIIWTEYEMRCWGWRIDKSKMNSESDDRRVIKGRLERQN